MQTTAQWLNTFLGYAYLLPVFHRTDGKHRAGDGYWGNSPVPRYVEPIPVFDSPQAHRTFFWSNGVKYYANLMCGQCGNLAKSHPITKETNSGTYVVCSREASDWTLITWGDHIDDDRGPDYYLDGIAAVDYSGPGSVVKDKSNEDWSKEDLREAKAIERWRDNAPVVHQKHKREDGSVYYTIISGEHTRAINGWDNSHQWDYNSQHAQFYDSELKFDADRNIVFERVKDDDGVDELETGYDGFFTTLLIDPVITEKHHHNIMNAFVNKRGRFCIGSMELTITEPFDAGDKWVTATCVNPQCAGSYITIPIDNTVTREYQEAFVWACIAHGNNHAIHWIVDRVRNDNRPKSWDAVLRVRGPIIGYEEVTESRPCAKPSVACDTPDCDHLYIYDKPIHKWHRNEFCSPNTYLLAPPEDDYRTHYTLPQWLAPKEEETEENFVHTLMEHNSACMNPSCKCEELLKEQIPALLSA